ncbi:hypothetical protein Poli38472_013350 [Pythium oligandrum]|uniref:Uncharacterized protein n=1 Tax=Pythium oligandrum TaxID=41045 RepID=A0A8K1C763_PYTOL|nr:hypothetical protein Poli38472_013350 [Pythium oligandrum]|eukprot:TMW57876.1 hypothetical protein Poli38472_013350 [Pythium oligandrum]
MPPRLLRVFSTSSGVAPSVTPSDAPPPSRSPPRTSGVRRHSSLRIRVSVDLSAQSQELSSENEAPVNPKPSPAVFPAAGSIKPLVTMEKAVYRVVWLGFLLFHIVLAVTFTASAAMYMILGRMPKLAYTLGMVTIIPTPTFPLMATIWIIFALFQVVALLHMLLSSVFRSRLVFSTSTRTWATQFEEEIALIRTIQHPLPSRKTRRQSLKMNAIVAVAMATQSAQQSWFMHLLHSLHCNWLGKRVLQGVQRALRQHARLFSRDGFFGLNSEWFDVVFTSRQFVLVVLQTFQAYLASLYLWRARAGDFLVFTVVLQCWSPPLLRFYCVQQMHSEAFERVAAVAIGVFLAFWCFCGVGIALLLPPGSSFSHLSPNDTFQATYIDDVWLIRCVRDLQYILMGGGVDATLLFSSAVVLTISISTLKPLLASKIGPSDDSVHPSPLSSPSKLSPGRRSRPVYISRGSRSTITPEIPNPPPPNPPSASTDSDSDRTQRMRTELGLDSHPSFTGAAFESEFQPQRVPIVGHPALAVTIFFFLWGIIALGLHVRAYTVSGNKRLEDCRLELRPWSTSRYACAVYEYNCQRRNVTTESLDTMLLALHRRSLSTLIISSCPDLRVPASIQNFPRLLGVKIYNSTVTNWPSTSALSQSAHPQLQYVRMIRTNLSEIPEGLRVDELPSSLQELRLCTTNLTVFRSDLKASWSKLRYFSVEDSHLEQYPDLVRAMGAVASVSVAGNAISSLPDRVFVQNPSLKALSVARNPIAELPERGNYTAFDQPTQLPSLRCLDIRHTNISTFPAWLTSEILGSQLNVKAGNTPICSVIPPKTESVYHTRYIHCNGDKTERFYPLELEDALRATWP